MILIGHTQSSQFMEWQHLGVRTHAHAPCAPNVFKILPENQITTDFTCSTSSNFVAISGINYWDQVNSWKHLWEFWNGPLCRNEVSSPYSMLQDIGRVATAKLVPRNCLILANSMENGRSRWVSEFLWGIVEFAFRSELASHSFVLNFSTALLK